MTDSHISEKDSIGGGRRGRFKINAVSELTGVSPDVLRVWERRYAAVTPHRTSGGTRLYDDADVWRIMLLRRGIAKGYSIGRIVNLPNEELEKLRRRAERPVRPHDPHAAIVNRFINYISEVKFEAAESELAAAVEQFPTGVLIEKIFSPILIEIGNCWQHGEFGVAEEHLASNVLRSVLISIGKSRLPDECSRAAVLATPEGERHEFGLMLSALSAALSGWRIVYLGLETPAEEIARTVRLTESRVVGLSIVAPPSEITRTELIKLDLFLPPETAVVVGGGGARIYHAEIDAFGWTAADSFEDFAAGI